MVKLEVGKWYLDHSNFKWKCVHYCGENTKYPYVCVCDDEVQLFSSIGAHSGAGKYFTSLISEWVEPVEYEYEMALVKMKNYDGREFVSLQNISGIAPWDSSAIIARKTITITEGEGL